MPDKRLRTLTPKVIDDKELVIKVINLRREGKSYDEVGKELGLNYGQVMDKIHGAYELYKEQTVSAVDELKLVSAARLEKMIGALWESAMAGDTFAVREIRALDESLRKLYGADAPAKMIMDVTNDVNITPITDLDRAREIHKLLSTIPTEGA